MDGKGNDLHDSVTTNMRVGASPAAMEGALPFMSGLFEKRWS